MVPVLNQFDKITGRFVSVNVGRRTQEVTHDWAAGAAAKLAENPAELSAWLALADRLADEGNPAEHLIRLLFVPGYAAPAGLTGELYRGGRYMENGQHYSEGASLSYTDGSDGRPEGWSYHYWSNGGCVRDIVPEEAREIITKKSGANCAEWHETKIVANVPPRVRVVPVGTEVCVIHKGGRVVNARYAIQENIPVPADAKSEYYTRKHFGTEMVTEFEYKGFRVRVPVAAVAVS